MGSKPRQRDAGGEIPSARRAKCGSMSDRICPSLSDHGPKSLTCDVPQNTFSLPLNKIDTPRLVATKKPPIDLALRRLVPTGSRAQIRALFGNRVTWGAIQHWRAGRARPPQWAVDCLRRYIAPVLAIEPGHQGAALKRWRAKQPPVYRPNKKSAP